MNTESPNEAWITPVAGTTTRDVASGNTTVTLRNVPGRSRSSPLVTVARILMARGEIDRRVDRGDRALHRRRRAVDAHAHRQTDRQVGEPLLRQGEVDVSAVHRLQHGDRG